jgi:hypothetical protein
MVIEALYKKGSFSGSLSRLFREGLNWGSIEVLYTLLRFFTEGLYKGSLLRLDIEALYWRLI